MPNASSIDVSRLKHSLAELPIVSDGEVGIGGVIKSRPEHFIVEEILPYRASGNGEHVFVTLKRTGWNTAQVAHRLAEAMDLKSSDVGWGGRKDKNAVTTQTFSLQLPTALSLDEIALKLDHLPFDILDVKRHGNKIKTGHVAANRFDIILAHVHCNDLMGAMAIARCLEAQGMPNFYGQQRFGHQMVNLDRAAALFNAGRKIRGRQNAFLISALQSALFNVWLRERMTRGAYQTILLGDITKKTDTGGMFTVTDVHDATQRFINHKIVYTGPIFGYKMKPATDAAGLAEARVLEQFGLSPSDFKTFRAKGSRRPAIVYPKDLDIQPDPEGLRLRFTLPAGAYATTLLREFTRS